MSFSRLVLASRSPRRIELLRSLDLTFEVHPPNLEEPPPERGEEVEEYVIRTALAKARCVSENLNERDLFIISADTVVVVDGEILGKPRGEGEAQKMLRRLSGREHQVYTGLVVYNPGRELLHKEAVMTRVWFRDLSGEKIKKYVKTGEPLDKAGAYGIQGRGATLVLKIDGDYFNVVGLPIGHLVEALEDMGAGSLF